MKKLINNAVRPRKDEFGRIICDCCGTQVISDDPEIAEEGLCDRCADEINNEEIIGYRKGE